MTRLRVLRRPAAVAALGCALLLPAGSAFGEAAYGSPYGRPHGTSAHRPSAHHPSVDRPSVDRQAADDPAAVRIGDEDLRELAGSPAGAGRERPGRPADAPANPEVVVAVRPAEPPRVDRPARPALPALPDRPTLPDRPGIPNRPDLPGRPELPGRPDAPDPAHEPPSASWPEGEPPASSLGTGPDSRAADLAAHILPLGTGLALIGLGLGFIGVRLRRD
ncbi:hypothetical protein [Streptomyces sp. NPDC089799]|uniref:hypothetical protein n=1 Tax=Streptomyces sp. NPDC089799 TaxID=3155066 RepID=UPI00343E6E8A